MKFECKPWECWLLLLLLLQATDGDACDQAQEGEGGEEECPREVDDCVPGEDIESNDEAARKSGTFKD